MRKFKNKLKDNFGGRFYLRKFYLTKRGRTVSKEYKRKV